MFPSTLAVLHHSIFHPHVFVLPNFLHVSANKPYFKHHTSQSRHISTPFFVALFHRYITEIEVSSSPTETSISSSTLHQVLPPPKLIWLDGETRDTLPKE
ncbi:hypothetical protein QVD17_31738 [Tagetes erecta]|uniref:Uncharacterized protein n=1 Tax=Tagetes erecta TaxID=13708 RepID=A0AAD8NHA1_TARER|nr:hypothetical protein QVD17_31738 [Tagetes erecta]